MQKIELIQLIKKNINCAQKQSLFLFLTFMGVFLGACQTEKPKTQTWAARSGQQSTRRAQKDLMRNASLNKYVKDQLNPETCFQNASFIVQKERREATQLACMQRADLVDPAQVFENKSLRSLVLRRNNRSIVAKIFAHEGASNLRGDVNRFNLPFIMLSDSLRNVKKNLGNEVIFRASIVKVRKLNESMFLLSDETQPAPLIDDNASTRTVLVGRKWIKIPGEVSIEGVFTGQSMAIRLDNGLNTSERLFEKGDFVVIGQLIRPDPYAVQQKSPWQKELQSDLIINGAVIAPIFGEQKFF